MWYVRAMTKVIKKNSTHSQILDGISEYGKLRQHLAGKGVFERAYGYYFLLALFAFSGFFVCAYFIVTIKSIPLLIVLGMLFAFFTVQISGILHDAGHRTIFKSPFMNDIVGYICGIVLAMGYSGWKSKHNKHHAHPNQEEEDPDLEIPLLSFTQKRLANKKGLAQILRKYQAFLYYPMGSLVCFSVRIESIKFLIRNFGVGRLWEIVLLSISIFVWFAFPFIFFGFPKGIVVFLAINLTTGFYLLNVFAPNHKGMTQFAKNVKVSFMEQQIMTSRNIYGNFFTDFIYMGLNYQIEHHLFPNTARNKLKQITPYVMKICRKRNLEFTQTTIIESNKIILSELQHVARSV